MTLPNNFTPGTTIKSSEVNEDLQYLDTKISNINLAIDSVYVNDYNDGELTSTTIQLAIDDIGSTKTKLIFDGTYIISDDITIPSNIVAEFTTGSVLTANSTKKITFINKPIWNTEFIGTNIKVQLINDVDSLINNAESHSPLAITFIEPGNLDGHDKSRTKLINDQTGGNHFISVTTNNFQVENVEIEGSFGNQVSKTGTALIFGSSDVIYSDHTVNNCKISSCGFDALGMYNQKNANIIGNSVTSKWDTGIDIVEGSHNAIISNNRVECDTAGKYGIFLDSTDYSTFGYVRDNIVTNNFVTSGAGSNAVQLIGIGNAYRSIISNNILSGENSNSTALELLKLQTGAVDVIATNNIFRGKQNQIGINVHGGGVKNKRANISNSNFYDLVRGVQIYYADAVNVSNSLFHNCGFGVASENDSYTNSDDITISNTKFVDCAYGIRLGSAGGSGLASINNVTFKNSVAYDLTVDPGWKVNYTGRRPTSVYNTGTINYDVPYKKAGTTGERPASGVEGDIYCNSTTSQIEYYNGTNWQPLITNSFSDKQVGWASSVGTPQYGGFNAATVSLADLAKVVLAIQQALEYRNAIGA